MSNRKIQLRICSFFLELMIFKSEIRYGLEEGNEERKKDFLYISVSDLVYNVFHIGLSVSKDWSFHKRISAYEKLSQLNLLAELSRNKLIASLFLARDSIDQL